MAAGPSNNFCLAPGEVFQQCPYNRSHLITSVRMLVHLDKCRKAYLKEQNLKGLKGDIVPCMFNFAHQYPKIEIDFHHGRCPDQHTIVDHLAYHQSDEAQAKAASARAENQAQAAAKKNREPKRSAEDDDGYNWDGDEEEEDWEKESKGNGPGYDPKAKLSTGPVIPIVPQGMTKSERKAFRNDARLRQEEYLRKEMLGGGVKRQKTDLKDFKGDDPYA